MPTPIPTAPITDKRTRVIEGCRPDNIPFADLLAELQPVVLKGLVSDWQLVNAGRQSYDSAITYLKTFHNGKTVGAFFGDPSIRGRYFYNDDVSGLNYENRRVPLDEALDVISRHIAEPSQPTVYIGSTTVDACLPGMRNDNDLVFDDEMFAGNEPLVSIWIGNPSIASAHYDAPNNLACCAVGRRRYTLFPAAQIHNLYPGPLDLNPGGQAISMVDFANPDLDRYPRFRDAVAAAQVADLEPGDALFYPSMWWHQVEALDPFNVMINYWWNTSPAFMGTPMNVLKHALLSLRDRPEHEKAAWKEVFDYYIFESATQSGEHLPEKSRGVLAPIDDDMARQLRAQLLRALNR